MATSCPKCEARNPHGAEICGDCGQILSAEAESITPLIEKVPSVPKVMKEKESLPEISLLTKSKREKAPLPVQMLSGILLAYGIVLILASFFLIAADTVSILSMPVLSLCASYRNYFFLLCLIGGLFTFFVSYGISNLKEWAVSGYILWVFTQVVIMVLARIYNTQLGLNYSAVVLGELLMIPLLIKVKRRFFY